MATPPTQRQKIMQFNSTSTGISLGVIAVQAGIVKGTPKVPEGLSGVFPARQSGS